MMDKNIDPPFDVTFAVNIINDAIKTHMPAANMDHYVDFHWRSGHSRAAPRLPDGLIITVERDLSEIQIQLNLGNMEPSKTDVAAALERAMSHFPKAVENMIAARRDLKIHAITAGLIAILTQDGGRKNWHSVKDYLSYAIRRRTFQIISPLGDETAEPDKSPLSWSIPGGISRSMRMPGKRIIPDAIRITKGIVANQNNIRVPTLIPAAVIQAKIGSKISDLIDLPGLEMVPTKIKGSQKEGSGTLIKLTSDTLDMEQAFELMARIINAKTKA